MHSTKVVMEYEEPTNIITESLNGADKAMNEEMKSMEDNSTWEHTTLPEERKAIGFKWVFKRKRNIVTGLTKNTKRRNSSHKVSARNMGRTTRKYLHQW